jgi:hypothetical protein
VAEYFFYISNKLGVAYALKAECVAMPNVLTAEA